MARNNIGSTRARALSVALSLKRLDSLVASVIFFRAPRWPFKLTLARQLDRLQRQMLKIILRVRPLPAETAEGYSRRAAKIVARIQDARGAWSCLWASRIISWGLHIQRNTANNSWPSKLMHIRSSAELNERRALYAQRTGTRSASGWCQTRWSDGVSKAVAYLSTARFRTPSRMEFDPILRFVKPRRTDLFAVLDDNQLQPMLERF